MVFCEIPNCSRGPGPGNKGFKRKDNLLDHMRRRHDTDSSARELRVSRPVGDVLDNVRLDPPPILDEDIVSLPQKKRRRQPEVRLAAELSDELGTDIIDSQSVQRKKRREETEDIEGPRLSGRELELMNEIEKLKKERETMVGIIDRLTK